MKYVISLLLVICLIVSSFGCATFKTCYRPSQTSQSMEIKDSQGYLVVTSDRREHLTRGSLMKWNMTGIQFTDIKDGKVYSLTNDQISEIRCKKISTGWTIGAVAGGIALVGLAIGLGAAYAISKTGDEPPRNP